MATAGPNSGSSAANGGVGTITWASLTNPFTSNDAYTTAQDDGSGSDSRRLDVTGFGFAIPTGATIGGVTVSIERKASTGSAILDRTLKLLKAGSVVGDNKASGSPWGITDAAINYGGVADLWGTTWTAAEVNASNFGVSLVVFDQTASTATASVDHITVTVTYTEAVQTETLLPVSDDSIGSGWLRQNAVQPATFAAVDEGVDTHDSSATYNFAGPSVTAACVFGMANPSVSGTFTSITLRIAAQWSSGSTASTIGFQPKINSTAVGSEYTTTLTTSFAVYEQTWTGSWSNADMNTLQVTMRRVSGGITASVDVTAVEAVVSTGAAGDVSTYPVYEQWTELPRMAMEAVGYY